MIRATKFVAICMVAVFAYSFVGVLTAGLHEKRYPGAAFDCIRGNRNTLHCSNGSTAVGLAWPVGLPLLAAVYAAEAVR